MIEQFTVSTPRSLMYISLSLSCSTIYLPFSFLVVYHFPLKLHIPQLDVRDQEMKLGPRQLLHVKVFYITLKFRLPCGMYVFRV